jgi:hypothetical protein
MTLARRDDPAVFLHGGGGGRDSASLADSMRAFLPRTHLAAPDAATSFAFLNRKIRSCPT